MADAAVEFLLNTLNELLLYHGQLIGNAKAEVEKLEIELRMFKALLEDTIKVRRKDERLKNLVREIRDVVHEAEDMIERFVTQAKDPRSKKSFAKMMKRPVDLLALAKEVQALRDKIKLIIGNRNLMDLATLNIINKEEVADERLEAPIVRQANVVGLEDEAKILFGYLEEETSTLDPISIIGMPGLGKTTITGKIYHDPEIQYRFPTRLWVYVSQEFNRRKVFLTILSNMMKLTDDMYQKADDELANLVCCKLEGGDFLIVLDDIWTTDDWDNIKIAFPVNVKMGKILITSRFDDVGHKANPNRDLHKLRLLEHDEGWLLLQYEVFGKPEFPQELEAPGRLIVKRCGRLPLAIVVIGGILAKKGNIGDITATLRAWSQVSETVNVHLSTTERMEKIIDLSYHKLPFHLRACFLYLGIFPEDFEIPAWKLTRMWIAEGFIHSKDRNAMSLQNTAENYLDDLINWNLVRVDKRRRNGKVKTCRIHDMLHKFCRHVADEERENFLKEVKVANLPGNIHKSRRLCISPDALLGFFSSKPQGPCVRTFVCSSEDVIDLPAENVSAILAAFKLVRVLEVKPIKFPKLPSDLYQLVHLRFIVLTFNLTTLPRAFTELWNLQTLIVDTPGRTLDVKAGIWNMMNLTHFKTNASANLPSPGKNCMHGDKILTLGTISPESCNEKVLKQVRNVKKLGIRGRLASIFDSKNGSFDSLGKMSCLEKLTLTNDIHPKPPSEGKLQVLPLPYQFPRKLRWLTMSKTYLDWTHMKILGLLENLEVLKLKDQAFMGDDWHADDGGFSHLEFLYIERTDLVRWEASTHTFPKLRSLELKNCWKLEEIPLGLADIPTFKILDLEHSTLAEASAIKIHKKKTKNEDEKTPKFNRFKLSIFPPRRK